MNAAEKVKSEILGKFNFLTDAIRVQREKRIWLDVSYDRFPEVFDHLVNQLQFTILSTITGLDEGPDFGFIYHLAQENGLVLSLKTRIAKDSSIKTVTNIFAGAMIYEREIVDLLGAKIEGLPEGRRYPLPDDWPADQHPLRKDWRGLNA